MECVAQCCINNEEAFQPVDKQTLSGLSFNQRNFQSKWYKDYPWLSVCATVKKVFCLYCRYGSSHGLLAFSKCAEDTFTKSGFNNWKKALEKFRVHENSHAHKEAKLKWIARCMPTITTQLSSQMAEAQKTRREGLVVQLKAIKYLTRQGLALRGNDEEEGNLSQLLLAWSENNDCLKEWIKENRYTSHQAVNEQICLLGQAVLRKLLKSIKDNQPSWYAVIADEATDVTNSEQLNLSIRWVGADYIVREDTVGLFRVPDTKAETLFRVIKDLLIRCNLPISLCRGQAYDGASNMLGRKTGVATRFKDENPAAIAVHCCAHSLNLCLQDAGRKLTCIRDALETAKEIGKLIRYSPKRSHLFSTKLQESGDGVTLKPLCPTRWTARTAAIEAILTDYTLLLEALDEIQETTHDEYGQKAGGLLLSLEKFSTLFGLRLSHLLFAAAEQVSLTLQKKDIALNEALSAVEVAKKFFKRTRSDESFNGFYDKTVTIAQEHSIGQPELPRYRRRPARYEDGSDPHVFSSAKTYFRQMYFEACYLLHGELDERFQDKHMSSVIAIEKALICAANGQDLKILWRY